MPPRDSLAREARPTVAEKSLAEKGPQKAPSNQEMAQNLRKELEALEKTIKTAEKDVEILQGEEENEGDVDPEVLADDLKQLDLAIEDLQAKEARQQELLRELAALEGTEEIDDASVEVVDDDETTNSDERDTEETTGLFEMQKSPEASLKTQFKRLREQERATYEEVKSLSKLARELDDQTEQDIAIILGSKVKMYKDGEPGFYTPEYREWIEKRQKDIAAGGGALAEIINIMKADGSAEERMARINAIDTKTLGGRLGIKSQAALLQEYVLTSPTATRLYETRKQISSAQQELGELYKERDEIQRQLPHDWVEKNI